MSPRIANPDPFAALGDATRRAILRMLARRESTVAELARPFDMTRPAISQHLRILRAAGLVEMRDAGRYTLYRLRPTPLRKIRRFLDQLDP